MNPEVQCPSPSLRDHTLENLSRGRPKWRRWRGRPLEAREGMRGSKADNPPPEGVGKKQEEDPPPGWGED